MQLIDKYFPELSTVQKNAFSQLGRLYQEWNEKINVISRKDIDNLYLHHVLHSLSIAKIIQFAPDTTILDVGTGGGFPGIPLAILFPEAKFHLIDSIGKKIIVVNEISQALGLTNVIGEQIRVEQIKTKYDFVVSRAVTRFDKFAAITRKNVSPKQNNSLKNGIIYLKGGDFADEIQGLEKLVTVYPISAYFVEPFFETKKIIHLPVGVRR
jgi:16S rRNA (guanine527-N7)-methyltransferase